jgi:hypothetical protein
MTKEYTGMLLGGPDDGSFVASSLPKFPAKQVVTLYLDGKDKDSNEVITEGFYVWHENGPCFKWEPYSEAYYTRKKVED